MTAVADALRAAAAPVTGSRPARPSWVMHLAPTGLHAAGAPPPPGDGLDVDDAAAWQRQASAVIAEAAPDGLAGRAVRIVVDDRLVLPGVMSGRLWPLRHETLQAAALAWFAQQGDASDWRVRAVLQADGRHALVAAMREAVLQAVADAVELAGGRLDRAVPRWALALAGAEAATPHGRALVAAPRAGADHVAVALRVGGSWQRVELEPVDDGRDDAWAVAAESLVRRDEAVAAATDAPNGRVAPPHHLAACDGPVAAPATGADWSAVASWPVDTPAARPWSAAALDLARPRPARGTMAARAVLAACLASLVAGAVGLQADWQRLQTARAETTTTPPVTASAPRLPLPAGTLAGLRAELGHPWLTVLDRLAADRPEGIVLQRVEPVREAVPDGRLRVTLTGQAAATSDLLAWKRRLESDSGLHDVRLLGWEREGDAGRIGFRLEVGGGPDG